MGHFVALRQFHLHARVRRPGEPLDVVEIDTVFMLQRAAHPDRRGLLKLRQADSLAHEIFRLANAAFGIDENIRMAKRPRRKNRNRRQRFPDRSRNQIRRQRNLRGVEVIVVQHARPDFQMRQHEPVELEPFRLDGPIDQRMRPVVVAASNG